MKIKHTKQCNNKRKNIFTKSLSLILALAMCISPLTCITTYAESGVGDNAENTGGGGSSLSSSTSALAWSQYHQGYRIYVINANLERISPTYDFLYSAPEKVGTELYTTRFDTPSSPNEHYKGMISKLQEWCDSTKEVPPPTKKDGSDRVGNGAEFKNWFFAGEKGSTILSGGSSSAVNKGSSTSTTTTTNYPDTVLVTMLPTNFFDKIDEYWDETDEAIENIDIVHTVNEKISIDDWYASLSCYEQICNLRDAYYQAYKGDLGKWIDTNGDGKGDRKVTEFTFKAYCSYLASANYLSVVTPPAEHPEAAIIGWDIFTIGKSNVLRSGLKIVKMVDGKTIIVNDQLKVPNNPITNTDLLTQSIPLAGSTTTSEGGGTDKPAANLVSKGDTIKVNGYIDAAQALKDGCYLVVEPITWLYVRTSASGAWDSTSTYESTRTYGTYWNLAQKWVGTGGFYNSIMTKLFNNCLATSKDTVTSTGKTVMGIESSSQKSIAESLSYMNSGYGLSMHIYDANDFKEAAGTHTYDSPISPGSAPDPTALPNETEYGTESKKVTIIKNYVSITDGTESTIANYTRTLNPHIIQIEDEPQYKVVSWETSTTTPPSIPDGSTTPYSTVTASSTHTQTGTAPTSVTLDKTEKCLYVKLQKQTGTPVAVTGDWTLHESEISKPVTTGTKTSEQKMTYSLPKLDTCNGHTWCAHPSDCDDCAGGDLDCNNSAHAITGHNESCFTDTYCGHDRNDGCGGKAYCTFKFTDNSLTLKLNNTKINDYPTVIANISESSLFTTADSSVSATRESLDSGSIQVSGFTHNFVIYRGDDKLSYAGYINNLNILGFNSLSSKTAATRKVSGYKKSIAISLSDSSTDLTTAASGDSGHGTCSNSGNATTSSTIGCTGEIAIQTYSGKSTSIHTEVSPYKLMNPSRNGTADMTAGRQVASGGSTTFNPYIQMTYAGINGTKTNAYVLSEYRRTLQPNDYAEISWTLEDNNLNIISQQWSLDINHTTGEGWRQKNSVLKGGATYSLETKEKVIKLNTYQSIVGDPARSYSQFSGSCNLTEAEAVTAHNNFVASAIAKLDTVNVVQYVCTDTTDDKAYNSGIAVSSGSNISMLNNGCTTASTEDKYYLHEDDNNKSNIQRGDLDVKQGTTRSKYYRFYSDTSGNIYMSESTSLSGVYSTAGSLILSKTQDSSALTNAKAKVLNQKTYIVDKLVTSLERNTGNDATASWAPDGKWYNEAYQGIVIMEQSTEVALKFSASDRRTTVLDPKLIPKIDSKTNQGTTAFAMQYCTDITDDTEIGVFKGTPVFMYDGKELFNSRKVYITNMTVQNSK